MYKRYTAKIPNEYVIDNCYWIAIVPHVHNNEVVGYYLNLYEDLSEDSTYDTWFEELEDAKQAALEDYGIGENEWKEHEVQS